MSRIIRFACVLLFAWAGVVQAQAPAVDTEAGMVVSGSITVNPDGSLVDYQLDKADKISPGVKGFLDQNIRQWKFQPVAGVPANAIVVNDMSLRLVAKPAANGAVQIALTGFNFYPVKQKQRERTRMTAPRYPVEAARAGVSADVYLVMKVDGGGRVLDVIAEQVNLQVKGSDEQMRKWRKMFADASIDAARRWKLNADEDEQARDYQVLRVPVGYSMGTSSRYGQWIGYVPGPRQSTEWSIEGLSPGFSPDALVDGLVYQGGPGTLKLQKAALDNS